MWPQIRLRYQCRDTENTYTVASIAIVDRNVKLRLCLSHIFCGSYVEEEFIKY